MPSEQPFPGDLSNPFDLTSPVEPEDEGPPTVTIYHNGRCSKSQAAMQALKEADVKLEVRAYLDQPPGRLELLGLIESAGGDPRPFVRTKEVEAGAVADEDLDDASKVATLIAEHPSVLQRPILLSGGRAVIARDAATVQAFLADL